MYCQLGQGDAQLTGLVKSAMEDKLKLQSRANHDQVVEEIQEIEQKKTEETLRMVQKKHDSWRYQIERGEARRLQSSGNSRRVRKGLDLQHPTSSEPCRPSEVDYDEEMALEPLRKRPEWPEWEEARGREKDAWRLEPEGETEVPETGPRSSSSYKRSWELQQVTQLSQWKH